MVTFSLFLKAISSYREIELVTAIEVAYYAGWKFCGTPEYSCYGSRSTIYRQISLYGIIAWHYPKPNSLGPGAIQISELVSI